MFKRLLVANRGEIAVRIVRACRDLGISPLAVYSEADREALHVKLADEAYPLGPAEARESYLNIDKLVETAQKARAEAVHPGYGFLAENDRFAEACQEAGLVFVGPAPHSIRLMGDKIASRKAMEKAGVPVIPGSQGPLSNLTEARRLAEQIGFPVMIKASAGGGGKGMRVVADPKELPSAFETARGEALSAFGDPTLYLEKYLPRSRHIEIQILADNQGHRIHLGERECSIQRRHQKLVEEAPSPAVDSRFREELGQAALEAARAVDYCNAGTVEFIVDASESSGSRSFYFLEMNTRLQVEHPVTEIVTGIDLVVEQIRIAAGEPLRLQQSDVTIEGWALECRICAEDPYQNFLPCPGTVTTLYEPSGPGIRVDSGVYPGFTVPLHYDPLISKLVAHGRIREEAMQRMCRALREYRVAGVQTTIPFFLRLLEHPEFRQGRLYTRFLEEQALLETASSHPPGLAPVVAAALYAHLHQAPASPSPTPTSSTWKDSGRIPGFLPRRWR